MNKDVTCITQLHKRKLTYTVDCHTTPLQFIGDAITDHSNEHTTNRWLLHLTINKGNYHKIQTIQQNK